MTKHKRNLAVAGGVISSILLSPMLAALAVGELMLSIISVFIVGLKTIKKNLIVNFLKISN